MIENYTLGGYSYKIGICRSTCCQPKISTVTAAVFKQDLNLQRT